MAGLTARVSNLVIERGRLLDQHRILQARLTAADLNDELNRIGLQD